MSHRRIDHGVDLAPESLGIDRRQVGPAAPQLVEGDGRERQGHETGNGLAIPRDRELLSTAGAVDHLTAMVP
jgi:hypothetical protein